MAEKVSVIKRAMVLVFFAMLVSANSVAGNVIYVDDSAIGANDGTSWADAYNYLQDALAAVSDGEEIRVAQGVYKPDQGANQTPGDWMATFELVNGIGVTIKGGYAGHGKPDPDSRDIDLYETILSGDLYGNDVDVNDPEDMYREPTRSENSYHVLSGSGFAVIDGLTITGGNANDSSYSDGNGGGMRSGDPAQISNCTFTKNSAIFSGGAIYSYGSTGSLINCIFKRNFAGTGGGGGIHYRRGSPSLTNCTFIGNSTFDQGGGMHNDESDPMLTNCTFIQNSTDSHGGGMYNRYSSPILTSCKFIENTGSSGGGINNFNRSSNNPTLRNCLFIGNRARTHGGGIYNYSGEPVLINCTFAWNSSDEGNALYCREQHERHTVRLFNCILWDGGNEIWNSELSIINIFYSNIKGGWFGEGNIDEDPLFADPDGPDDIPGTEDDDLRLATFSPCIDSGLPNYTSEPNETDIDGNPRVVRGRVDMGAYEFQEIIYINIYVDADAVGANNGSNWENAYLCLQDALEDNPAEAHIDYEIRVANGIYIPDRRTSEGPDGTLSITSSRDRTDTFLIRNLTIKGGYAGYGEPDPNAQDINLYETILSGDLHGNDVDVSNSEDLYEEPSRAENSFHVVTSSGIGNSVIDGFTITGGNANDESSSKRYSGGGLLKSDSFNTLQIINCTFTGNSADSRGGGINNRGGKLSLTNCAFTGNLADPGGGGGIGSNYGVLNLTNCTFTSNHAGSGGGGGIHGWRCTMNLTNCTFIGNSARYESSEGGGIYIESNREYQYLTNCTFIENSARAGGGIYSKHGSPILTNCVFRGNSIRDQGGGMCNTLTNRTGDVPILRNCLFIGNRTHARGGGVYNLACEPILINCTFAGNSAGEGNALYGKSANVSLFNCILWDGGEEIQTSEQSVMNIFYSNIQGGWDGEGNIDANPFFADPDGPDNIPGTEDDDLRLSPISPCVDAGDPNYIPESNETDLSGNPRLLYGRIDMGAYEFQGLVYVDNDASEDLGPGDILSSDPLENGTEPHPMDSIQEAIDIAKDGYTVLVQGGVYGEPIDFKGKAITVTSECDVAVLETPGDYAVSFLSAEGPDSILKNFVIRNSVAAVFIPGSSPTIRNLTVVNNEYGITAYTWAEPDISNCIFWNNSEADLFQCEARYSCIEDGGQGQCNISVNPLFVNAENGDYHLMSEGWRWNGSELGTYDDFTSFCIDAGDPASPLGDEPMSAPRDPDNIYGINLRINMGAYGGTCQASIPPLNWIPKFDRDPPIPDPAQWAPNGEPREIYGGGGTWDYRIQMTGAEATDSGGGPVEYFFECTTESGFSSGWLSTRNYVVLVGRTGQNHRFRVKARDQFGNETAWSELLSAE